eukprot:6635555-Prymnesium_polylepis.1
MSEDDAAAKLQAIQRGNKARAEVASQKASEEGAAEPEAPAEPAADKGLMEHLHTACCTVCVRMLQCACAIPGQAHGHGLSHGQRLHALSVDVHARIGAA